jgi:hypothetical protein
MMTMTLLKSKLIYLQITIQPYKKKETGISLSKWVAQWKFLTKNNAQKSPRSGKQVERLERNHELLRPPGLPTSGAARSSIPSRDDNRYPKPEYLTCVTR